MTPMSDLFCRCKPRLLAAVVAAAIAASSPTAASAGDLVVGTGSIYGVYFQAGRGICELVNRKLDDVKCSTVPTAGSMFNMDSVRDHSFDLGIVQSDVQYRAHKDSGYENLRTLFSVHGEPFTVVARRDSGIRSLSDLEGRRVNLGNPGSGQRATMDMVMAAMGWTPASFALVGDLPAAQQSSALCRGEIEAMVYVVGHPNMSVAGATDMCDSVIVDIQGPQIDQLIALNPFYSYMTIPGGLYKGNARHVRTFGVRATVMVSENMDDALTYGIVKVVFENLDEFRRISPVFKDMAPESMIKEGLTAPLHAGAARYFREVGLM